MVAAVRFERESTLLAPMSTLQKEKCKRGACLQIMLWVFFQIFTFQCLDASSWQNPSAAPCATSYLECFGQELAAPWCHIEVNCAVYFIGARCRWHLWLCHDLTKVNWPKRPEDEIMSLPSSKTSSSLDNKVGAAKHRNGRAVSCSVDRISAFFHRM